MNRHAPINTRVTEITLPIGKVSENTSTPAKVGTAAPTAALNGIMNSARPRENDTCEYKKAMPYVAM